MKDKKIYLSEEEGSNPFSLSIGDLMAALLLIFILLLSATLLNLQERAQSAEDYRAIKEDIYKELVKEFKYDLKDWKAEIDPKELTFRFKEPDILFENNKSEVKPKFKEILGSFFPRYIKVLSRSEFKDNIEEIRIEGHTDDVGNYYHNMELSQDRTRSVLSYVLEQSLDPSFDKDWLISHLTANGLSFSKPLYSNQDEKGRSMNRRVEFRIRTNAEKQIDELLKISSNE